MASVDNHPPIEGIISTANVPSVGDKISTPGPYGIAPQAGYPPSQSNYGAQQPNYIPPAQGGYGPPTTNYGPGSGIPGNYGPPQPGFGPPQGGFQGVPISNQPMPQGTIAPANHGWMNIPHNVPNCPPGLEYLTMIDQLLVHQEIELLEVITKYEGENKFTIHNSLGQKVYKALESSDACMRNVCGSFRPFEMKILDNFGTSIIHLHRPFACQGCCCPCYLQKMEVSSPPGTLVGSIEQEWSLWVSKFAIKNTQGDVVLRITGPICTMACCGGDVDFKVMTPDGNNQVGKISKKWSGYAKENFTDADNFGINFPMDLDVRMKAVMLGACFLIDMMYYERTGNQTRPNTTTGNTNASSGTTTINRV